MKIVEWLIAGRYFFGASKGSRKYHVVTVSLLLVIAFLFCLLNPILFVNKLAKILHFLTRKQNLPAMDNLQRAVQRFDYYNYNFFVYTKYAIFGLGLLMAFVFVFVELRRKLSVFTTISVMGFLLGTSSLIIVTSIMSGLQNSMLLGNIDMRAHIRVSAKENKNNVDVMDEAAVLPIIKAQTGVVATSSYLEFSGLLLTEQRLSLDEPPTRLVQPALIHGINVDDQLKTIPRFTSIIKPLDSPDKDNTPGSWENLKNSHRVTPKDPEISEKIKSQGIMIGKTLAENLRVRVGEEVLFLSYGYAATPLGNAPKTRKFLVVGIFTAGSLEFDSRTAYVLLSHAQRYTQASNQISGIQIRLKDELQEEAMKNKLSGLLGDNYNIETRSELSASITSAIKLEKIIMFIILTLIIIAATFSVVSSGIMLATEKKREIAILKTLGASSFMIQRIFLWFGLIMGILGAGIGALVGLLACWIAKWWQLPMLQAFHQTKIPVVIRYTDVGLFSLCVLLGVMIAIWYPSRLGAKQHPLDGLK